MDEVSRKLRDHYQKTFLSHGPTSQGVDWGHDDAKAELRYEKMLNLLRSGESRKPSLLDVGCGYGGLLKYAKENQIAIEYTGIDVVESMIDNARSNHPDAVFLLGDVLEVEFGGLFDYVVCNGILTQKLDVPGLVMDEFASRLIRRMFALCRNGVAFNVMKTKINYYSNNLYYRNPAELFSWCMCEVTPYLKLDHAYPLYEYTVYLYRDPVGRGL